MSYKQQIPTWPGCENLSEDERAMTFAYWLVSEGEVDRARSILEQLPSPQYDAFAERKLAEIQAVIATRQEDWLLGLGMWEDYCESLAIRDSICDGLHASFADFFEKYAGHLAGSGDDVGARRFAQKAKRLKARISPLARLSRDGPTPAPE